MRLVPARRRGVASVVGTLLFVIVLLAAFASLEYIEALQSQSVQAQQAALNLMAAKASTSLTFQYLNGLSVTNTGPAGLTVVDLFLKFANGSIFTIGTNTPVSSGGNQGLSSLVSGTCGGSSCISKYNTLLNSNAPGSTIGVMTSAGASFWYAPASQASVPNSCSSVGTLSMQVSPSAGGATNPGAVSEYCNGQQIVIEAFAAPGYQFSSWSGSGSGSYTGSANLATVTVNNMVTETANFVSASPGGPFAQDPPLVWATTSLQSTVPGGGWRAVTPLAFTGTANTLYQVTLSFGYYQSVSQSPGLEFGVSAPSGATMFACGGIVYPTAVQGCIASINGVIGGTTFGGNTFMGSNYCTSSSNPCLYQATIYVTFGSTSGTFQVEFQTLSGTTGTVIPNSIMTVTGE